MVVVLTDTTPRRLCCSVVVVVVFDVDVVSMPLPSMLTLSLVDVALILNAVVIVLSLLAAIFLSGTPTAYFFPPARSWTGIRVGRRSEHTWRRRRYDAISTAPRRTK